MQANHGQSEFDRLVGDLAAEERRALREFLAHYLQLPAPARRAARQLFRACDDGAGTAEPRPAAQVTPLPVSCAGGGR